MKPVLNILIIAVCLIATFVIGIFITNGVSYAPAPHPSTTFTRR